MLCTFAPTWYFVNVKKGKTIKRGKLKKIREERERARE
jgi:hypothetical protein